MCVLRNNNDCAVGMMFIPLFASSKTRSFGHPVQRGAPV